MGFGLQGWDLDLEAEIWTLSLGSESEGRGTEEEEKAKKEEKIPHICERTGHQLLWGRCPAPPSTFTTTYLGRAWVLLTM